MRRTAGWADGWCRSASKVAFTPLGVVVALTFIGLPFVVRTLQPVLDDLDREVEQAAATLGASAAQAFIRVILPALWPSAADGVRRWPLREPWANTAR